MKRTLSMITLAVLTVGLLGSCSKINERLDNLEKKVDGIENEQIATITGQIAGIESSIADLKQIRSDIGNLKQTAEAHGEDIFALQEADETLGNRIDNLEDYLKNVLPNYAEKEWVEATYSTLEQYDSTCTAIAEINVKIGELDTKIAKDIETCVDSMKTWVNEKLDAYYTAAQMDAELAKMRAAIDSTKASGKISDTKADSVAAELTKTKTAVDTAKSHIRSEYKAAIKTAIDSSEAKLTKKIQNKINKVKKDVEELAARVAELETKVDDLTDRVDALEQMIQSVTIVPAYSDGSVKVQGDSLYVDFIVSPSNAVTSLAAGNVAVLVNSVKTKAYAGVDTIRIGNGDLFEKDDAKGTVSVRVYVADKTGSPITVAVNVWNGLSNITTEFAPVTSIPADYVEIGGQKWATKNLGATTVAGSYSTCAGDYYKWGSVNTIYESISWNGNSATFNWRSDIDTNEGWGYFGYNNREISEDATAIPDENDVAKQKLGNGWRMPTTDDFYALFAACGMSDPTDIDEIMYFEFAKLTESAPGQGIYWLTADQNYISEYKGVEGILFVDGDKNKLFFPAAGYGMYDYCSGVNRDVLYWTSSGGNEPGYGCHLDDIICTTEEIPGIGCPVRAVKGTTPIIGALKGEFSVGVDKKVRFSRGNLWNNGWGFFKFEVNQYDFQDSWDWSHISHFYWSNDADVAIEENYSDDEASTNDVFFTNTTATTANPTFTVNGVTGKYRTLSTGEWQYLLNTRTVNGGTGEGRSYQRAYINSNGEPESGVYGLILYPDNYTGTAETSYTSTEWKSLEKAGCVFLPATGSRSGSTVEFAARYWSSSANESSSDAAYLLDFFPGSSVNGDGAIGREKGLSVRLVTDVE